MNSKVLLIIGLSLWALSSIFTQWSINSKNIQIAVLNEQLSQLKEKNIISDSIIAVNRKTIDSIESKIDTIYLTRKIIEIHTDEKERDILKLPIDSKIKLLSTNLQRAYKNSNR